MHPINKLTSTAAPLPLPNIDTDQIIPKQFLKRIERDGYGDLSREGVSEHDCH